MASVGGREEKDLRKVRITRTEIFVRSKERIAWQKDYQLLYR